MLQSQTHRQCTLYRYIHIIYYHHTIYIIISLYIKYGGYNILSRYSPGPFDRHILYIVLYRSVGRLYIIRTYKLKINNKKRVFIRYKILYSPSRAEFRIPWVLHETKLQYFTNNLPIVYLRIYYIIGTYTVHAILYRSIYLCVYIHTYFVYA